MKKVNLAIIALISILIFVCAASAQPVQKFKVPEYSLEGPFTQVKPRSPFVGPAEKLLNYYVWENNSWKLIDQPSADEKRLVSIKEVYRIDRNKDGKMDLLVIKDIVPERTDKDGKKLEAFELITLVIDDDFDGVPDRMLTDGYDSKNQRKPDGIFDKEQPPLQFDIDYFKKVNSK
jgi:hypothetical protein